jgi:DNA-binding SARP family transcriptional activator/tetratricopeptide (TPR) repeat protein
MKLKLLGPLELVVDRVALDLGGPRQRMVLATLALKVNRVVPVEQLIDAVWDTSPPSTARGQIQICISSLRRLFGDAGRPEAIKTRPPGYVLELAVGDLDSLEFAELLGLARREHESGNVAVAVDAQRAALALWRGVALGDVPSEFVQRAAALLEATRLTAIEERMRMELELGRHEEVLGELAELVEEYPLRERFYGFLMLALYRSGRQTDALDVRRKARAVLIEELGIEPGQELQDLERAILNRDSSLDLAAPSTPAPVAPAPSQERVVIEQRVVPHQLPSSIADFTGREEDTAMIRRALAVVPDSASSYAMRIVAISGKGGVGKSSLAIRVAHELSEFFPDGQLYCDLQSPATADRASALLSRCLRALGVSGAAVPDDVQERTEMYRSMLAGKRVLVVLDDVTSEEQVQPLLPGSPTCAVITTSRVRLSGLSGAQWLDIDVFDSDRSIELLTKILGDERVRAEPEAALELAERCGGLPLALRIAGGRLGSRPHKRINGLVRRLADETNRLDEFTHRGMELRSTIGLTYDGLDRRAKRLFRLFALLRTAEFPSWVAAALLDTDLADAEEIMDGLVDARMLDTVEYPRERVRYRFHDLIRVYAVEQMMATEPPEERDAALRRVLGGWLALAEDVHRGEYGGDYTIMHGSAPRWRPPDGETVLAQRDPLDWWDAERNGLVAAVRQAAAAGMDELCWDLALTSMTLFEFKGYYDHWRETAELGLEVTERAGNRVGWAAMQYYLGTLHMFQKRLDDASKCFASAMEIFVEDGNEHGQALVLRNAAVVDGFQGRTDAMLAKYDSALVKMRAVGDRMGEAYVLRNLARARIEDGDTEPARELLVEALDICREVHCLRGEAQVVHQFAFLHLTTGEVELATRDLHRVLLLVRDMGDRIGEAYALYGLGTARVREGRLDSAETMLKHALSLAKRVGERLVEGQALLALGEIDMVRNDFPTANTHLREATGLFADLGSALWHFKALNLLCKVHVALGDTAAAASDLERAAQVLLAVDSPEVDGWRAELDTTRAELANDRG